MSTRKAKHDCPYCICGQVELTWSDRSFTVFPDDMDEVAETIIACALDHYYDRYNGVPDGLGKEVEAAVSPVVAKHLAAVNPDWRTVSIDMTEVDLAAFKTELIATLRATSVKPADPSVSGNPEWIPSE